MKIKRGNTATLKFGPLKDADAVALTNLATATGVKFMIKENKSDADSAAIVSKTLASGITVNSPSTSYIAVELTAPDTRLLTLDLYYFGLQVEYAGNTQEIYCTDATTKRIIETIDIEDDIIV